MFLFFPEPIYFEKKIVSVKNDSVLLFDYVEQMSKWWMDEEETTNLLKKMKLLF